MKLQQDPTDVQVLELMSLIKKECEDLKKLKGTPALIEKNIEKNNYIDKLLEELSYAVYRTSVSDAVVDKIDVFRDEIDKFTHNYGYMLCRCGTTSPHLRNFHDKK